MRRRKLKVNSQWAFGSLRDLRIDPQREREEWGHDPCQRLGMVGTLPSRYGIVFSILGQVRTNSLTLTELLFSLTMSIIFTTVLRGRQ